MELIALLALLVLLEGVVHLPPGATCFRIPIGTGRAVRAQGVERGLHVLPLRPGALEAIAAPLPIVLGDDAAYSTAPVGRFGLPASPLADPTVRFDRLRSVEVRDRVVRAGERGFAQTLSPAHATALAGVLDALARAPDAAARREIVSRAQCPLSIDAVRERIAFARDALRWLARSCDCYALALFGPLPLALWRAEDDALLLIAVPALAGLHVATVACAASALRRLEPTDATVRRRTLLAAALFPPTLLRLPQRAFLAAIGVVDPETTAAALLDSDERVAHLRRALARAERGLDRRDGAAARIVALASAVGIDAAALRERLPSPDATAHAYCPACETAYRAGVRRCVDCAVALVRFE